MKKFLLSLLLLPLFLFSHEVIAFYNPNCSCCHKYFSLLEQKGLKVKRVELSYEELLLKKDELGVPIDKRSCHTMVLKDGRFIEGHVPVEGIEALVKSNARGVYSPHGVLSGMGKEEKEFFLIE